MSCSQKRWLLCKTQRSQFSKILPVKITWKVRFSMLLMSSQFPRLSHCVHHRIEVPVLNCFVSAEQKYFPKKATFLWKQVGLILWDTVFVCEKDPVKENVAYIVKREKTESSRKFEHMIKDALDIYRRRYKGERRNWERKSESVRKGEERTPAAS